ncbi:MAG: DUF1016 family protein [Nannocystaceae bacterium]|nr:DUF1016 family protein [Nannocystaceae bacterium]
MAKNRKPPQGEDQAKFLTGRPGVDVPHGYGDVLSEIKQRISHRRIRAATAANLELVMLYWEIGGVLRQRIQTEKWGTGVIDRLSHDLREAHPEMRGLSTRNLRYMAAFAEAFADRAILQQAVAQLPWGHIIRLLDRVKDPETRLWYARHVVAEGWSRAILDLKIDGQVHLREGQAQTNFDTTLPPADSDLAQQAFKDPYLFDFLGMANLRREREVEQALVDHIQKFLLELGSGFAFVGRQVSLEIGNQAYTLDLLFYHLKLRRFVVIELKAVPFEPEFVGKINLYLSAVDDLMRHPDDKPTIGLLLCREKNRVVVEYALRDIKKPIGVAEWETQLVESLPDDLKGTLPTVKELEAELQAKEK